MGWMVRHCAWVVSNFQVKGTGRTPYHSIRGKDDAGEVMPFGEVCLERNHSEDGPKLKHEVDARSFLSASSTALMNSRC